MKTSTILAGIAITLLALALPAGAADYTLGVFGNANEDDTINMQDVTYTELIILEYKEQTQLADGKHDDRINMQDVTQIELIILGREKELTVIDTADRTVTVNMPIERIVTAQWSGGEIASILNVNDKVVGVPEIYVKGGEEYAGQTVEHTALVLYSELCELPSIGYRGDPDIEAILSLNPDICLFQKAPSPSAEAALEAAGIPVVVIYLWKPTILREEILKCGYILGKTDEAEEYIDFCREYENEIKELTEGLSEAERPRVYFETLVAYQIYAQGSWADELCALAGGRNIAAGTGLFGNYVEVDKEWVASQNPDIIIKSDWGNSGNSVDDVSGIKAVGEEIEGRDELAHVNAVDEGKCYVYGAFPSTAQTIVGAAYYAKWIQPDLFEDLDPKAIHQEFLDKFFGDANFDLDEHGVFVYHPVEHPEGS